MMEWLAYISFSFLAYQLINVLANLIFRQKIVSSSDANGSLVSILIPARDEEGNIGHLLQSLQTNKNGIIEIVVLDDASSDGTALVVKRFAAVDPRIKLLQSTSLPEGWLGKNHACHLLAKQARGEYLLFVDADVRLSGQVVQDAVAYLKKHRLGLLSLFPVQVMRTWGERCVVPLMNYILLTLLPLVFIRVSPFRAHAAANGQFMLFSAEDYKDLQPHERFKTSIAEDITISRYFKKQGIRVASLTGDSRVECRMYASYSEAMNGFAKNIHMMFGNWPPVAFLFWFLATLGAVPVALAFIQQLPLYLFGMLITIVGYSLVSRQNILHNMALFPVHLVTMMVVMLKGLKTKRNKQYSWKGRNIYSR